MEKLKKIFLMEDPKTDSMIWFLKRYALWEAWSIYIKHILTSKALIVFSCLSGLFYIYFLYVFIPNNDINFITVIFCIDIALIILVGVILTHTVFFSKVILLFNPTIFVSSAVVWYFIMENDFFNIWFSLNVWFSLDIGWKYYLFIIFLVFFFILFMYVNFGKYILRKEKKIRNILLRIALITFCSLFYSLNSGMLLMNESVKKLEKDKVQLEEIYRHLGDDCNLLVDSFLANKNIKMDSVCQGKLKQWQDSIKEDKKVKYLYQGLFASKDNIVCNCNSAYITAIKLNLPFLGEKKLRIAPFVLIFYSIVATCVGIYIFVLSQEKSVI
ncbi:MAG: hypothetical protein MUE81_05595 [Thermoflexibacter sp.]|jgi:hypothetical protein|nr:hypothetical protein [Thermoflexibacter sp.]